MILHKPIGKFRGNYSTLVFIFVKLDILLLLLIWLSKLWYKQIDDIYSSFMYINIICNVPFLLAGELDEETVKVMALPRCGVRDKVGFGESRAKRYALQGNRSKLWNSHYVIWVNFHQKVVIAINQFVTLSFVTDSLTFVHGNSMQ